MSEPVPASAETSEMSLDRALREARTAFERFRAEHERRCRDFAVARHDGAAAYAEVDRVSVENGRLRQALKALLRHAPRTKAARQAVEAAQAIVEETQT